MKPILKTLTALAALALLTSCDATAFLPVNNSSAPAASVDYKGEKGDKGDPGQDGTSIYSGRGAPSNDAESLKDYINGDHYIDLDTGKVYIFRVDDEGNRSWTDTKASIKGDKGNPGKDGTSLRTGTGAPASDLGIVGDSYLDLSSWDFYVKENQGWVKKGTISGGSTPSSSSQESQSSEAQSSQSSEEQSSQSSASSEQSSSSSSGQSSESSQSSEGSQSSESSQQSAIVTDVLNNAYTGISGNVYSDWSLDAPTSSAHYVGQSAGDKETIQLRSNNNNSGIVTTVSGGKAVKITVSWHADTYSGRTLDIYGKNSAYEAATDLYDDNKAGTKLGSIVNGTSTELVIQGDYAYIGLRSNKSAMYLISITIDWQN